MPITGLVGMGLGALGSWIGSEIGENKDAKAAERNYQYAERLAQNNYNRQVEQWNRENEYNTPLAQLNRVKDSGLSVSQMYNKGGGAALAGGLSQITQGSATMPQPSGAGYAGSIMRGLELQSMQSQIDLNQSQAEKNRAEARSTGAQMQPNVDQTRAQTAETMRRLDLLGAQIDNLNIQRGINDVELQVRRATMENDITASRQAVDHMALLNQRLEWEKSLQPDQAAKLKQTLVQGALDIATTQYLNKNMLPQQYANLVSMGNELNERYYGQIAQNDYTYGDKMHVLRTDPDAYKNRFNREYDSNRHSASYDAHYSDKTLDKAENDFWQYVKHNTSLSGHVGLSASIGYGSSSFSGSTTVNQGRPSAPSAWETYNSGHRQPQYNF